MNEKTKEGDGASRSSSGNATHNKGLYDTLPKHNQVLEPFSNFTKHHLFKKYKKT